jgi:hypothetical protein
MTSMYYSAAWTDFGFLLGCSHEHKAVTEATCCIPCAGGYVVAVENGAMRGLRAEEQFEFQCGRAIGSLNPAVETTPAASAAGRSHFAYRPNDKPTPTRRERETLLEFGLRFLSAHALPQHSEPLSHTKNMGMNTELIDGILSRSCELDTTEFRRMCAEDEDQWANVLGKRLRTIRGQE